MRIDGVLGGALLSGLLWFPPAGNALDLPGLRMTTAGTLFRITASGDSSPQAAAAYKIAAREQDDPSVDGTPANLAIRAPTPLRDVVTLLLSDSGLSARFSGNRAMEAAIRPVGPALFSGGMRGALSGLAQQAGLQVHIRRDQVEFTDRRGYRVEMPAYEDLTGVAARLQQTRATNVRIAGGMVEFDADQEGMHDVQNALREIRAGRRGAGNFLSRMLHREPSPAAPVILPPADPAAMMRNVEAALAATARNAAAATADPLQRLVSIEFDGDATEGLRQLAKQGGVHYKVASVPKKSLAISLRIRQTPLRAALESFDAQLQGAAELIYVRSAQRIDLVAR